MKFLKIIGKILSVFVGLIISIVCFTMIIYMSISNFMKVDNLKQSINTKNLLKIEYGENTLKDNLIASFNEIGISENDMKEVIESNEFNELFDDYLDKVMKYYLEDGEFPTFNEEKLNLFVNSVISKSSTLSPEQTEYIKEELKKEKVEIEKTLPDRDEILKDADVKEIINIYNSISIFYFIGTIIILMFLIFIFTWSLHIPFLYAGISFVVPSIVLVVGSLFKNTIIKFFNLEEFINIVLNQVFNQLLTSSLIMLSIGIIFIIIYIVIEKTKNKVEA